MRSAFIKLFQVKQCTDVLCRISRLVVVRLHCHPCVGNLAADAIAIILLVSKLALSHGVRIQMVHLFTL